MKKYGITEKRIKNQDFYIRNGDKRDRKNGAGGLVMGWDVERKRPRADSA